MKLFYAPGACSLAPHIALCESGLRFELERVNLRTKRTGSGQDFTKINPKGCVPAIEIEGEVLTEAAVILAWIADQAQDVRLAPQHATMERYRVDEWLSFLTTELHENFAPFFTSEATPEVRSLARERLTHRFDFVEDRLRTHDWLAADAFTIADAYAFVMLRWADQRDLELHEASRAYRDRIAARPNVRVALIDEDLNAAA